MVHKNMLIKKKLKLFPFLWAKCCINCFPLFREYKRKVFKSLICLFLAFQLNDGGKAARANVGIGDVVLTIDGISTDGMTHLEAQNKIKACTGNLNMTLQR